MSTRSPRWVTAAAVTTFFLNVVLFAAILPRPAAATDQASPPARSVVAARPIHAPVPSGTEALVARGQYLARIGGCHDCHTEGYALKAGDVPADRWLTGSAMGYKGPWGVSYPSNLRLSLQQMTETQWLAFARVPRLPPMPWFNLRDMSDADLRALYHFIRALGPAGTRQPAAIAPGAPIRTPYIETDPQNLPVTANR